MVAIRFVQPFIREQLYYNNEDQEVVIFIYFVKNQDNFLEKPIEFEPRPPGPSQTFILMSFLLFY